MEFKRKPRKQRRKKSNCRNNKGITLLALIITIIVLVILAGVAINTLYGENGIISNTQDAAVLSNIKSLEEGINLYKIDKNLEGKVQEESYPIALNEDGSKITLSQMKNASELAKLPDGVKYTLLNLTAEKGTTNIPTFEQIDYSQFYKLDNTKLNMSEEEAKNLVIYIEGDNYKVINLAGVKYQNKDIYVIIPLNNEAEPEYITVANNTYKLYGDGTLKALGEKTVNSGYTSSEVNEINDSWDEFDLKAINERFDNRMNLPETLTSDWYAGHVYFSTGTAYVIDQNNDLWAWGANDYNKLGLGHSFLVVEPTKILEGRCEGKENAKASKVWAGDYNTFIVYTEGMLWACGNNGYGTLGQGNNKVYNKWVRIEYINGNNIKQIIVPEGEYPKSLIIMKDGTVYAAGANHGQFGEGNRDYHTFSKIDELKGIKKIELGSETLWYITNDNVLYGCGYTPAFGKKLSESPTIQSPYKIAENVRDVKTSNNHIIYITNDNKLYYRRSGSEAVEVNNIKIDENTKLLSKLTIILNNDYYYIEGNLAYKNFSKNVKPYYNKYNNEEFLQNYGMYIIQDFNEKIYIKNNPNITKIGEKANFNLKNVMKNVKFIQGKGVAISIVTQNGEIYEKIAQGPNLQIKDAKKIIASSSAKYVIKKDGTLWARGQYLTGMWGEIAYRNEYVKITRDGTNNFENIKNIFTSKIGNSAIFITEDNKLYWAGSDGYIILPRIKGDFVVPGGGTVTYYSKEVTSPLIEKIIDKIKDIEYSYINNAGINGANTLILTEDGKLYTMSKNRNMSGNNTYVDRENGDFTELIIKEGTTVKQILTEDGLSLALLSNGEVYGWGYNTYGILGASYEVGGIYPTPVKLEGLPANIRYMSLGNGFAIFASKSGEVYGIGKNDYGQLGTGDSIGRTEFVRCTKLEE